MIKYFDLKRINEPYVHAADEVLRSGWYLKGDWTRRFEEAYADYIGTKHCIGCGNGLNALTLIFRAYMELGVMQEGDVSSCLPIRILPPSSPSRRIA